MNLSKIRKVFTSPKIIFWKLAQEGAFKWMSDELYLKIAYKIMMGERLHLDNPITYNEKLQWLKLFDRKPIYTTMVDKYEVKKYVSNLIGEEYIIPTYGVWDRFEDINFDNLPSQFVLKCTHDSGGIVICRNKAHFDIKAAEKKIKKNLNHNFYWTGRDWPYKDVQPRIIAEKYMEDSINPDLRDYKFFVFDGVAKVLFVASNRQTKGVETRFDFFDMEYNHLPIKNGHENSASYPLRPKTFGLMRELAEKLGQEIPQSRMDFYEVDGRVYFGEITLFHYSGMVPFEPAEWDRTFGNWITLPKKINNLI